MPHILEAQNVSKRYGQGISQVVALDRVTLTIDRGEVVLIMGPSGSGKTTLLSIMGCILRPTDGAVVVEGQNVTMRHEAALPDVRRQYFGFVFQAFNLFKSLSAVENVEVVLRLKGLARRELRAQALSLLERVGLEHRAHNYPGDLSGGEKQRTAIARALAGDPPIILADEPTANLDSKTGTSILELLRDHASDADKAIAIVSHDPKAKRVAHRVAYLEDGRLKLQ